VLGSVLTVWALLVAGAAALLGLVGGVAWLQARRRDALGPAPSAMQTRPSREYYARLVAEAHELSREAAVSAAATHRAAAAETAARIRWAAAQQEREAAWQAYEIARREATGTGRAEVVSAPAAEDAVRHDVSRAALAAYRRGELSVDQLRQVYRQASGWTAAQERYEHELVRRRAAEHAALLAYRAAAGAETAAREAADIASVAARALHEEAEQAAAEAEAARQAAQECVRRGGWRLRGARR